MRRVEEISKYELTETLIFSKDDILNKRINFKWVHPREFRYNDNMYDIITKEETSSYIIFKCVNDEKEKELEKNFQKKLEENTGNKNQRTARILLKKILSGPIFSSVPEKLDFMSLKFKSHILTLHNQIWKEVTTPPPKNILA